MLQGIDHLVIAVPDLQTAITNYEALGFRVVPGGRHPVTHGTHNALIALQDGAYVELIAFYRPNPGHRWWEPLRKGGGLIDVCLRTSDLLGDTMALRKTGLEIADPVAQSRTRPDGYELRWLLSLPGAHRGVAPFLIQDETPRDERVPRQTAHRNHVIGIDTITIAVEEVATIRLWYASVLGEAGRDIGRDDLDAAGVCFTIGPHRFEFVVPKGPRSPLAAWLRARGPSPYAAVLRGASGNTRALDDTKTLGVRLVVARPAT